MTTIYTFCLVYFLRIIRICDSQWVRGNSRVPVYLSAMAIGSYNNSVHLLGGVDPGDYQYSVIVYDTVSDTFESYDSYLPTFVFGYSSYYTQIENTLYIIVDTGSNIMSYDLQTGDINRIYTAIPADVAGTDIICACLASNTNYLFVTGGDESLYYINTVYAYDIFNDVWLSDVPGMQIKRCSHTCIVHPTTNILYAIGGDGVSSIEVINTINIKQNSWSYISGSLSNSNAACRSVYFNNIIYVIGGAESQTGPFFETVHMIDTVHGTVTVSPDALPYVIVSPGSVIVNDRLYVFAGYTGVTEVNTWLYYDLETASATSSTVPPTHLPSTTTHYTSSTASIVNMFSTSLNMASTTLNTLSTTSTISLNTVKENPSANTTPYTTTSDITKSTTVALTTVSRTNKIIEMQTKKEKDIFWTVMPISLSVVLCLICICGCLTIGALFKWKQLPETVNEDSDINMPTNVVVDDADDVNAEADVPYPGRYSLEEHRGGEAEVDGITVDRNYRPQPEELKKLKIWFENTVRLPHYYALFVENGFEDLSTVSLMTSDDLKGIGINKVGHRIKLMHNIKCLNEKEQHIPVATATTVTAGTNTGTANTTQY